MGSFFPRVVLGAGVAAALMVRGPAIVDAQPGPAAPAPSTADKHAAKKLVDDGIAAQAAKDYDKAIELYKRAYALVPHPLMMFNIGQAHRLAGRPDQAAAFYERYLALDPNGSEAAAARAALDELKAAAVASGAPTSGAASKPGEPKATAVTKPGEPKATAVTKPGEPRPAETGALSPVPVSQDVPPAAVGPAAPPMRALEPSAPQHTDTVGSPGRTLRLTGLVLGGVGLASIAVGGYYGQKMLGIEADAKADADAGVARPDLEMRYQQDGDAAERNANIGLIVGGSLVLGGAVTYWLGYRKDQAASTTTAWMPVVGGSFTGIALTGSLP